MTHRLIAPLVAVVALSLTALDADAAKRFGGGQNLGKQRPAPTVNQAPKEATAAPAPSTPAQPATAPAPVTPAPQPGFMSRFGGLIAGLGIGALLGSLFGGNMGGMGGLLMLLLLAGVAYMVIRAFASRGARPVERPVQFAGVGSAIAPSELSNPDIPAASGAQPLPSPSPIGAAEVEPFLRVAKTSFIRLQAANDAGDLDDIRDYTTPEMYAEIAMQVRDRGSEPQRTEVLALDAKLVEAVNEGEYSIASVHFSGLIREAPGANPAPFDEVWHVRKHRDDPKAVWLISGIQQIG